MRMDYFFFGCSFTEGYDERDGHNAGVGSSQAGSRAEQPILDLVFWLGLFMIS